MRWRMFSLAVLCLPLACGVVASSDGSNTNWMSPCATDADCNGNECICGVCTSPCAARPCSEAEAECRLSVSPYCVEGHDVPICTPSCEVDADCTQIGPELTCLGGECVRGGANAGTGGAGGAGPDPLGGGAGDDQNPGRAGSGGGITGPTGGDSSGGTTSTGGATGTGGTTSGADSCDQCAGQACVDDPDCSACPPERGADGLECSDLQLACYYGPACGQTTCTCTRSEDAAFWHCVTNAC